MSSSQKGGAELKSVCFDFQKESPSVSAWKHGEREFKKGVNGAISRRTGNACASFKALIPLIPIWVKVWMSKDRSSEWRRIVTRLDTGSDISYLPSPEVASSPTSGWGEYAFGVTKCNGIQDHFVPKVVDVSFIVEGLPSLEYSGRFAFRPQRNKEVGSRRTPQRGLLSLVDLRGFSLSFIAGNEEGLATQICPLRKSGSPSKDVPEEATGVVLASRIGNFLEVER